MFKKVLGLDKIYGRKYGVAFLIDPLLTVFAAAFVVGLLMSGLPDYRYLAAIIYILIALFFLNELVRSLYARQIIKSRTYDILSRIKNTEIAFATVQTELNFADKTQLIYVHENSGVYDLTFDFMRHTKNGDYLAKQAFYTAFEIKLGRILPHLIFDSKAGKRTQFKKFFLQAQRLSLDVNFDDYFEVYAPKTYQIDALSFITPEVLQAIIRLKQYDLEIIEDSLFVYAPLLSNKELPAFEQQCLELYKVLQDNLDSYRDDRLTGERRISDVTMFGRKLLESPMRYMTPAVLSGLASAVALYLLVKLNQYQLRSSIVYLFVPEVIFAGYVFKIVKILRQNKQSEQAFLMERSQAINQKT